MEIWYNSVVVQIIKPSLTYNQLVTFQEFALNLGKGKETYYSHFLKVAITIVIFDTKHSHKPPYILTVD